MYRRAFSIMELLVVIAIIVLLIAILLPSLGKARENSRRAVCLSNTKGMTQSLLLYVADWNSSVTLDQKALNENANWMYDLGVYGNSEKIRQCPTAAGAPMRPGNAYTAWLWPDPARKVTGAYAMNGWLFNPVRLEKPEPGKRPGNDLDKDSANPAYFYKQPLAQRTSTIPVFTDAIWSETMPETTDFIADLIIGSYTSCEDQMGRVAIDRHTKRVDVSFFDGHSETVPIPTLWTFEWHPEWQTPTLPVMPYGGE